MKAWQWTALVASGASLAYLVYTYMSSEGRGLPEAKPDAPGGSSKATSRESGLKPGFLGKQTTGKRRQDGTAVAHEEDVAAKYAARVQAAMERLTPVDRALLEISSEMHMVHKLRVEGDAFLEAWGLRMGPEGPNPSNPVMAIAKQVEEQAEKAFFDSLAVELSREPPAMGRIMLLLSDVRDQLLRLCEPSGGPLAQTTSGRLSGLAAQIRERMEEGYMKQRIVDSPVDESYLMQLLGFVAEIVSEIGAPARSDDVQGSLRALQEKLASETAAPEPVRVPGGTTVSVTPLAHRLTEAARFVRSILQQLQRDFAKFQVNMLKQMVEGSGGGAAYEMRFFSRLIGDKTPREAFPRCARWLDEAAGGVVGALGELGVGLPSGQRERVAVACGVGVLGLMQHKVAVGPLSVPETLVLDVDAVVWLQNQLQALSLVAAILLSAKHFLDHKGCSPTLELMQSLMGRFLALLSAPTTLDLLATELSTRLAEFVRAQGKEWMGHKMAQGSTSRVDSGAAASSSTTGGEQDTPDSSRQDDRAVAEFLRNHVDVESPVYTRVQRFVLSAIAARVLSSLSSPSPAPDAGADAAVAALRKAGAEILKEEVHEVAGVVAKLVRSTVDVSEPFYQDILREGPMGQVQG